MRGAGRDDPRAHRRQRRARVGVAGRGAILALTDEFERHGPACSSLPATSPGACRPRRPGRRSRSTTSASRPSSVAIPAAWGWCATVSRPRSARLTTRSPRAAIATSPSCSTARGSWPGWRRASPKGSRSPASEGSGRMPTTSSCDRWCCCCAAAISMARSRACASWCTASKTRACCSPTACPGSAARWPAAATPAAGGRCCWGHGRRPASAAAPRCRVCGLAYVDGRG